MSISLRRLFSSIRLNKIHHEKVELFVSQSCFRWDSNPRSPDYKSGALTNLATKANALTGNRTPTVRLEGEYTTTILLVLLEETGIDPAAFRMQIERSTI